MNKLLLFSLFLCLFPCITKAAKPEKNIRFFSLEGSDFGTPINKLQQEELLSRFHKDMDLSTLMEKVKRLIEKQEESDEE